jgi:glutamate synthase domain-containing protein 1
MKKLFEIDNNEKQRILEIHRSAIKKHYLMEAEPGNPEMTTKSSSSYALQNEVIPGLSTNVFKFKKGASQINQQSIINWNDFVTFINSVINYLKKNKKTISNIHIVGSESQTPSKEDNFTLARKRHDNMENYILKLIDDKMKVKGMFTVTSHPKIGKATFTQGVDDPNDQKYLDDQWVKVWFTLEK